MFLTGFIKDTFAAKRLLQFSTRDLGFIHDYCYRIFNVIENPDASIYNIMMMAYVRRNYPHRAIHILTSLCCIETCIQMFTLTYTYPFLVEACAIRKSKFEGKHMHNHVLKLGFDSDVHVRSTFDDMYADCSKYEYAEKFFHESMMDWYYDLFPKKNTKTSNLMIVSFTRWGKFEKAQRLINELPKNDTVTWSGLIGCFEEGCEEMYEEALRLFICMHANGIRIDELVVGAAVFICSNFANLEDVEMMGKLIHSLVVKIGIECDVELKHNMICMFVQCEDLLSARNLFDATHWLHESTWYDMLDGYVKCGLDENVKALFESMPQKDADSCRLMISDYSKQDCFSESVALFQKMVSSGIRLSMNILDGIITFLPSSRFAT